MNVKRILFKKNQTLPGTGPSTSCSALGKPIPAFAITFVAKLRAFRVKSLRNEALDAEFIPMENCASWSFFDEPAEYVPPEEKAKAALALAAKEDAEKPVTTPKNARA